MGTLYVIQHTWIYLVHDSTKLISKVCTDNDSDGGESVYVRWFRPPVQSDLEVIDYTLFQSFKEECIKGRRAINQGGGRHSNSPKLSCKSLFTLQHAESVPLDF